MAPLYHDLYPGSTYRHKPRRLADMTTLFMFINLAYNGFKEHLDDALEVVTSGANLSLLLDIKDLCEFYIPTVQHTNYMSCVTMMDTMYNDWVVVKPHKQAEVLRCV